MVQWEGKQGSSWGKDYGLQGQCNFSSVGVGQAPPATEPCPGRVSSLPGSHYSTAPGVLQPWKEAQAVGLPETWSSTQRQGRISFQGKFSFKCPFQGKSWFGICPPQYILSGFQDDTSSDIYPVLATPLDTGIGLPRGMESFPVLLLCKDPVTLKVL